ncbi:MAG: hypothetical protein HOD13_01820, partial [Rhodospirillaceae bacterium]|nr:hypothetical protein [Rhodospirillaceae bacterium]
ESIPVDKEQGDSVVGASINALGTFKFKATKVGKDTVLAQIIKMVEDAQVVAVATDRGNKAVAFIIPQETVEFSEATLIGYCKQTLAGFKVPIKVISIDAFPSTPSPNGTKIQKGALRDLAMASI